MPLKVDIVTKRVQNTAELSPCLVPGARVVADLRRSELLARIGAFPLTRRSDACNVQALFVFATVFFLAGPSHRLQDFATTFARELRRIAQMAGLPKLYSAGALSRALGATDRATAENLSDALLVHEPGMPDLLAHPSVHHRDSQGDPWHVVDFDPTVTWRVVPSSDAAKPTEAADLGWVTRDPSPGSVDAEEGPVEVRIVLSRLRPTGGRARHGVLIDGYQVEMFGTTLPPEAWPADEVVALYRARAVIENRCAQEDREFATERTLSYHPWGQMLMVSFAPTEPRSRRSSRPSLEVQRAARSRGPPRCGSIAARHPTRLTRSLRTTAPPDSTNVGPDSGLPAKPWSPFALSPSTPVRTRIGAASRHVQFP